MNKTISKYFSAMGRKGGKKSRPTPEQARAAVLVRWQKFALEVHCSSDNCQWEGTKTRAELPAGCPLCECILENKYGKWWDEKENKWVSPRKYSG